jgi:hypothetical protein
LADKREKCAKNNLKLLKVGYYAKINYFFLLPVVSVRWMFYDRSAMQIMNCGGFHHNLRLCAVGAGLKSIVSKLSVDKLHRL